MVVSIATWHGDIPAGKPQVSSEFPAVIKPRQPSSEAIRTFLREFRHQRELSDKLLNSTDVEEINDETDNVEAVDTAAGDDVDDLKQEPPDHIKLVMEVRTFSLLLHLSTVLLIVAQLAIFRPVWQPLYWLSRS